MTLNRFLIPVGRCVKQWLSLNCDARFYSSATFPSSNNVQLIDGKKIAQKIQDKVQGDIKTWCVEHNRSPMLVAILVGDDPASVKYIQKKMEAAKSVGINSRTEKLPETITESDLIDKINELNNSNDVDGILVQLPVPRGISERNVCNAVDPSKDVDGFHITNIGKLCLNMEGFVPCTVLAVIEMLNSAGIKTFGKNVVVCGRSKNIGLPLSLILHSDARNEMPGLEATVTLCHRHTPPEHLKMFTKKADILISATGVINLIKPDMVKKGACVIDVGINRIKKADGKIKLVGDVDFEGVKDVAGFLTPVPGGVGPVTVAMLMKNTFKAAVNRSK